ncbi:MAG: phosphodiester glycosidase family protein [Phycisphaerales bacterium]|nr:phosphodiester glycosidase family protein [Phycisphaerales bacterium]
MIVLPGCSTSQNAQAPNPVVVESVEVATPAGLARGHVATINLADPRVQVVVTRALPAAEREGGAEAILRPVDAFAREVGATLAINANYFAKLKAQAPDPKVSNEDNVAYSRGERADVLGLSVSDGVVVSPERSFNGRPDPALVVTKSGFGLSASAGYLTVASTGPVEDAVAGIGASATDTLPGTLLVESGKNLGATARVEPAKRHPRTAAGVSADGRTLVLVVIDGRQKDWSVGMTLPELADLLIQRGCTAGVNLDGGGSTTMAYTPPGGEMKVMNRPSDGRPRAVANALAVVVE